MKIGMYAFKDTKIGYMNPWTSHNDETAIRTFRSAVMDENENAIKNHLKDIELYKLGTYNDDTGELEKNHKFLINGITAKGDQENE